MRKFNFFRRDKESGPVSQGVVTGIMEVCYIALVAIFMVGTGGFFNGNELSPWMNVFGIICMLSLLVLSVGISGLLVFGWPLHYFMERKYEEAVSAFFATIIAMFVIFAIIFIGASLTSLISF